MSKAKGIYKCVTLMVLRSCYFGAYLSTAAELDPLFLFVFLFFFKSPSKREGPSRLHKVYDIHVFQHGKVSAPAVLRGFAR